MFTKIDGELYKVQGNKMIKVTIKNGVIKSDNKVQEYKGGTYLLTMSEVRKQYASLFNVDTNVKENEQIVDDKDTKKEKAEVDTKVDTNVKENE